MLTKNPRRAAILLKTLISTTPARVTILLKHLFQRLLQEPLSLNSQQKSLFKANNECAKTTLNF